MTYYDNWSEFLQEARLIFYSSPLKTRYSVKRIKGNRQIVLKVTDDRKCCKFKLSSSGHLRQLNQLTALFIHWSVCKEVKSLEELPLKIEQKPTKQGKRTNFRRS